MTKYDEYSAIKQVAVRSAENAFEDKARIDGEWEKLRFYSAPDLEDAIIEHDNFRGLIEDSGAEVITLPGSYKLTLDSIYTRDNILVTPKGLILCNMGRASRTPEAKINVGAYQTYGHKIAGSITAPGTLEGGDFIWIDEHNAAVGAGPRTNAEGIRQLKKILGDDVDLHLVPLPDPDHPDDVLHLMSIISPLDKDLALVYMPFMPETFIKWLDNLGVKLAALPEEEYIPMGCNVLALAPRQLLMLDKLPKTKAVLEQHGCTVTTYKGDEISRKGEGGPTCLTRPLIRQ